MNRSLRALAASIVLVSTTGCATFLDAFLGAAIHTAADETGRSVGDAVGAHASARMGSAYAPHMAGFYTTYVFSLAFGAAGGFVVDGEWNEGDWARWKLANRDGEAATTIERAFLAKTEKGEWWRARYVDGASGDTIVLEGLLSREEGRLLRLRGQYPGDAEPREIPVTADQVVWVPPTEMSPESLEGATVGTETVTVPAGRFTARHVVYGNGAGGKAEWWLVDEVPGGVVRQVSRSESGEDEGEELDADDYELVLEKFGQGAKSELGVL